MNKRAESLYSLRLQRFQVIRDVLQPHFTQILVPFEIVEDRTPHRHFARAMCAGCVLSAGDISFHTTARESTAISSGNGSQVGDPVFERGCCRPFPPSVVSVACCAMILENLAPFNRNQSGHWRIALRRRGHGSRHGASHERQQQKSLVQSHRAPLSARTMPPLRTLDLQDVSKTTCAKGRQSQGIVIARTRSEGRLGNPTSGYQAWVSAQQATC